MHLGSRVGERRGATAHGARHPLAPLSEDEVRRAAAAVRAAQPGLDRPAFPTIALAEPGRDEVLSFRPGDPIARSAHIVVLERGSGMTFEALVRLDDDLVASWRHVPDAQPALLADEIELAAQAARADPRFVAALARRGVEDPDQVQIDPLAPGWFPHYPEGRRFLWATPYLRPDASDNPYSRPIENVRACVDLNTGEVLDVVDGDVIAIPDLDGRYDEDAVGGFRDDVAPLHISQPQGPGFTLDGHELSWQRWRLHVALDPTEGLVLHHVRFEDGGSERQILYRASLSEMVVPYGDPHPGYHWRSYFDAGEYGIGRMSNSLQLGCDCLGQIQYLDAVLANPDGEPETLRNAICVHEEDDGILWRHHDLTTATTDVRRSRRLVISSITTIGNYDYAFYWKLYQDGAIELEIKLTGVVLTRAVDSDTPLRHANTVAQRLAAPHHQHLFNVRLDMAVDGFDNSVSEVDVVASGPDADDPFGAAMDVVETEIRSERDGRRMADPLRQRSWKVRNPGVRNAVGEPVAYKLVPHAGPVLLANPDGSVGRRAGFARHHLWVTRYADDERHAGGDYPNLSPGGDGLTKWIEADRDLTNTDVVLWHTLGVSHAVRPEDWPVMPVERIGFSLEPVGFFDSNPALDVPPGNHDSRGRR